MNYEVTGSYISETASYKTDFKPFLLLILSIIFIPAAYVFVAAVFIVQLMKKNTCFKVENKSSILIYAYILIGVMSSKYKMISFSYSILMLLCFYSCQLFKNINVNQLNKIKKLIYGVSIIVFIIGILQYFNPAFTIPSKWVDTSEYTLNKRIYSTFFNPNIFGFYINFIVLLTCENLNFKKINMELIVFLCGVTCLIFTFSRTAWISLIIALILTSMFNKKYIRFALIIAIVILGSDLLLDIGRANPVKAIEDSSFLYRLEVWKACFEIIKDNFISGIGFGTLFKHVAEYSSVVSTKIEHCHNLYIQIFTETGVLGFSLFLIWLFNIIKKFRLKLFNSNNEVWITSLSIFAMTMIHGLVDSVALTPQILIIISMYAGTLKAVSNEQKNSGLS